MPEVSLVGRVASDDEVLQRCVALAAEALGAGDHPFGSVLVAGDGTVLAEDRNRVESQSDPTAHPEIELARWAADHLSVADRAAARVFTSGEHCAMCSAAHAWAGVGPIVTIATADMFAQWRAEAGDDSVVVMPLHINQVAPGIEVTGPVEEYVDQVQELYVEYLRSLA